MSITTLRTKLVWKIRYPSLEEDATVFLASGFGREKIHEGYPSENLPTLYMLSAHIFALFFEDLEATRPQSPCDF